MNVFKLSLKIIVQICFVIIFFSTLQAKNLDKFSDGNYISDYFSGLLLLNDNQYNESYIYLKKLDGLELSHLNYSSKYLYSLVNLGKFNNSNQNGQGWIRAEHGIGTGSTVPTHVGIMLACVAASGAGVAAHGYTIGDRIYLGGGVDLISPGSSPLQRGIKTHCDGQYVTVVINGASDIEIPKKHGGATPDNSTHFGTNVDTVIWSNIYTYFNVVAVVSE